MFMNFSENLFTIVDSISEYIMTFSNKLFINTIWGSFMNDNENIITATAIPFGMFRVMYFISFSV